MAKPRDGRRPGDAGGQGLPDRQTNPDAELARSFAIGCGVLFLAFLLLSALVFYFWTRA